MQTPIDFGKTFLNRFFDEKDADACLGMLAGDLVWITPEDMHHFLSEGAVLSFLQKRFAAEPQSAYVDVRAIKSSPSADNMMTVAYEISLVSREVEDERPLRLRCSMVICRRGKKLEITFLHVSKVSESDGTEQLHDLIGNLPCGVMILACPEGQREEAVFYNAWFAHRLRYRPEEFDRAVSGNPFFMVPEEDRKTVREQIERVRKTGGSISANLRFFRKDGNSFHYRMIGAPAYSSDSGTVYYCVFQETTGFRLTEERLQERLDTATDVLRQIPEAFCGIEFPPGTYEAYIKENAGDRSQDHVAEKNSEHAAEKAPENTAEKVSENIAEKAPENTAEKVSENIAEKAPENIAEKVSENAAEKVSENIAGKIPEKASGNNSVVSVDEGAAGRLSGQTAVPGADEDSDMKIRVRARDRYDRSDKFGRTGRSDRTDRSEWTDRPEWTDRSEWSDRFDSSDRFGRSGRSGKAGHSKNAGKVKGPRVFFTSRNLPGMFDLSNSAFAANILSDPFFGLEMTGITRGKLMASLARSAAGNTGKGTVSCGIFRLRRQSGGLAGREKEGKRVELVIRRTSRKDGTVRLYLFYYDREAQQKDVEERIDRAMKLGRTGQEQLRRELRKARESSLQQLDELREEAKKAQEAQEAELSRVRSQLLEEKSRAAQMYRQVMTSEALQKQMAQDLAAAQSGEKEAVRQAREARELSAARGRDAAKAEKLLEEQLREALERGRQLADELRREKDRRFSLEKRYQELSSRMPGTGTFPLISLAGAASAADRTGVSAAGTLISEAPGVQPLASARPEREQMRPSTSVSPEREQALPVSTSVRHEGAQTQSSAAGTLISEAPGVQPPASARPEREQLRSSTSVSPEREQALPAHQGDWMTSENPVKVVSFMGPDTYTDTGTNFAADTYTDTGANFAADTYTYTDTGANLTEDTYTDTGANFASDAYTDTGADAFTDTGKYTDDIPDRRIRDEMLVESVFSPEDRIRKVLNLAEESCAPKNILLKFYIDSRLPASVRGFAELLAEALRELVFNAAARSHKGGEISVHCRADRPAGGYVSMTFRIDDNGVPISEARMPTIFRAESLQELENADRARDRLFPEGLQAAREAAALMGGDIYARSGGGDTRFSLHVSLHAQS